MSKKKHAETLYPTIVHIFTLRENVVFRFQIDESWVDSHRCFQLVCMCAINVARATESTEKARGGEGEVAHTGEEIRRDNEN